MVPVCGLLSLAAILDFDLLAVGLFVEVQLERVFGHPALEAGAGPGEPLEVGRLVVAGPSVASRPLLADVASEHQRQIDGPIRFGGVEPVVDPFALVDANRFDGGDILGQPLNQLSVDTGDLTDGVEIVVGQVHLVHLEQRHHLDLGAGRTLRIVDCVVRVVSGNGCAESS